MDARINICTLMSWSCLLVPMKLVPDAETLANKTVMEEPDASWALLAEQIAACYPSVVSALPLLSEFHKSASDWPT